MERRTRQGRAATAGRKRVSVEGIIYDILFLMKMLLLPHVHIKYSRMCVCVCVCVCECMKSLHISDCICYGFIRVVGSTNNVWSRNTVNISFTSCQRPRDTTRILCTRVYCFMLAILITCYITVPWPWITCSNTVPWIITGVMHNDKQCIWPHQIDAQ